MSENLGEPSQGTSGPESMTARLHKTMTVENRESVGEVFEDGLPPGVTLGSGGKFTLTISVPTFHHFEPYKGERVYHYTTNAGVIGIVTSGTLWASAARNLNDGSEMKYGLDLLVDVTAGFSVGLNPEMAGTLKDLVARIVGDFDHARVFVVCASTVGDDLSQFRGYGDVAVELDVRHPLQLLDDAWSLPGGLTSESVGDPAWREVVYDPELQRGALTRLLERMVEDLERHGHAGGVRSNDICFHMFTYWVAWSVSHIKNPAFAAENEVRTVHLVTPEYRNFRFRPTPVGVVPFVEMRTISGLRENDGQDLNRLPISGVQVGPVHYPETAQFGIEQLLRANSYGAEVSVGASSIPFRA